MNTQTKPISKTYRLMIDLMMILLSFNLHIILMNCKGIVRVFLNK